MFGNGRKRFVMFGNGWLWLVIVDNGGNGR